MSGKTDHLLHSLGEKLNFLAQLGVDFVFVEEKKSRKSDFLLSLHEKILRCRLCPLADRRENAVPGEGHFDAPLMFVGEAPGADEDTQGRPFVGRAGQLLTRIIEAMKFKRDDVFITNVVKCRPPDNRTPSKEEIEACQPYLLAQVEAIQPRVIVTLGKVATDFFVPVDVSMSSIRGNFFEFGKILIMPTFHPSYVIRNEGNRNIKKLVWQDMQKVMSVLGKK
ncbi:MAG: uracil-DNA glycosylase [Clostridiales bacterium]|nr:uracil-DNA glycosylase [Clostridiales bacterium]